MNGLATFVPATPAMVVGQSIDGVLPPLGLSEPFALLGGDRLGPDGIAFNLMHEHQPAFRRWVAQSCQGQLAAERSWFQGRPLLLTGPSGAGRTHAARWLARVAGVPHVILNLSDPLVAAAVAASRRVDETLWASPITVAMAATRCANPIVTVIGTDGASADVKAGLAAMMDPETAGSWTEDQLRTAVDLGEVTWIVQCDRVAALPPAIRNRATPVALAPSPLGIDTVFTLSVMLEAMGDLGIEPGDPSYGWARVRRELPSFRNATAKELYAALTGAMTNLRHQSSGTADDNGDEYPI